MLEHPGWSGVLAVEEDIVMATNKPVGDNLSDPPPVAFEPIETGEILDGGLVDQDKHPTLRPSNCSLMSSEHLRL